MSERVQDVAAVHLRDEHTRQSGHNAVVNANLSRVLAMEKCLRTRHHERYVRYTRPTIIARMKPSDASFYFPYLVDNSVPQYKKQEISGGIFSLPNVLLTPGKMNDRDQMETGRVATKKYLHKRIVPVREQKLTRSVNDNEAIEGIMKRNRLEYESSMFDKYDNTKFKVPLHIRSLDLNDRTY